MRPAEDGKRRRELKIFRRRRSPPGLRPTRGWSLNETLIALLMGGVVAATALPQLKDQALKARRSDAWSALAVLELAQERHRLDKGRYAAQMADLGLGSLSAGQLYEISVARVHPTGYRIHAQARPGSAQDADAACRHLGIERSGAEVVKLSGSSFDSLVPDGQRRCWPR